MDEQNQGDILFSLLEAGTQDHRTKQEDGLHPKDKGDSARFFPLRLGKALGFGIGALNI